MLDGREEERHQKWKVCPPGHWVDSSLEPGTEDLMVDSPPHYTVGGYEALDVIKAKLTPEEYRGYCKGNILKYVMRANYKGAHDIDCSKAEYYARELNSGKEES